MRLIVTLFLIYLSTFLSYGQLTEKPLGTTASTYGFIEYLPPSYNSNSSQKLPIILFFHGVSEGGNGTTELKKVYNTGLPSLIKNNNWSYKNEFVVLMPQHHDASSCFFSAEIKGFIEFARKTYNIDTTKVFITGLSCGAIGLWNYIRENPGNDKVSAAVLIAGDGRGAFKQARCNIKIPIWAFHGTLDKTVLPIGSESAIDSLNTCPQPRAEAKLTLYEGVAHDSWTRTYNLSAGNDIYAWFLKKKSSGPLVTSYTENKPYHFKTTIYPNPSLEEITIEPGNKPFEKVSITILDINGKTRQALVSEEPMIRIALSDYAPGQYIVSIENTETVKHLSFIKR